ncbi:caspase-8 isoform X2 [Ctenopharyngodon idella]|uniref:caspase-8 isoform X2 n=1 Tax=Ctenopharyngodon idella TaxID=7959 RepID=UPI002231BCB8|nr:caspase-8 isoform X2 [Ctenopharyngodon idella]
MWFRQEGEVNISVLLTLKEMLVYHLYANNSIVSYSRASFLCEQEMEFQQVLLRVQESLTGDEVQDMVFLCSDLLSPKDLSTVTLGRQLFSLLENRDLLSSEDPSLLLELLRIIKRNSLLRNLHSDAFTQANSMLYAQRISPYRQLLYELSESICDQDLKNIKFLLIKTLPRKKLEKDMTLLQLFLEMEKEDLLGEDNLDVLKDIIASIHPGLEKRIIQYKTESFGGRVIAQEIGINSSKSDTTALPSPLTSVSSVDAMGEQVDRLSLTEGATGISGDHSQHSEFNSVFEEESTDLPVTENPEIQQYKMKGDRRGVCVIINNYDFGACRMKNREGTDIDKNRLEVVFQWLGFEVLAEQDCDRMRILQVLRDLAARDHTLADCVVCCVLSHGREDGVVGVDGKTVTFKELIETLSPYQCSSLYQKPKLFFIQACRGTREQRAVFSQNFLEDEDMPVSDAAVPRDSIPEAADYLLAMSTVPSYVSFREKEKGSWFIQSLCHNLQQLVPRGTDLLSILTQVNSDVSKKTDRSGLKKQMPQPEFTLTKRVVFPVPKTRLPLP